MPYTPPAGRSVNGAFVTTGYTPPAGNAVNGTFISSRSGTLAASYAPVASGAGIIGHRGTMAASYAATVTAAGLGCPTGTLSAAYFAIATLAGDQPYQGALSASYAPAADIAGLVPLAPNGVLGADYAPVAAVSALHGYSGAISAEYAPTGAVSARHGLTGEISAAYAPAAAIAGNHAPFHGSLSASYTPVAAITGHHVPFVAALSASYAPIPAISGQMLALMRCVIPIRHAAETRCVIPIHYETIAIRSIVIPTRHEPAMMRCAMPFSVLAVARCEILIRYQTQATQTFLIPIGHEPPIARCEMPFSVLAGIKCVLPIRYQTQATCQVVMPIGHEPPVSHCAMPFAVLAGSRIQIPIRYQQQATKTTVIPMGFEPPIARCAMPFSVLAVARCEILIRYQTQATKTVVMPFRLTTDATSTCLIPFSVLDYTPALRTFHLPFRIGAPEPIDVAEDFVGGLARVRDGRTLDTLSLSLGSDEGSWLWSLTAELAELADWSDLARGDVVALTVAGTEFRFVVDGLSRSDEETDEGPAERHTVSGRSPASILEAGSVSLSPGLSARSIAAALCAQAGLSLDWRTVDWVPPGESFHPDTPIQAIKSLAEAVGAVVQSSPLGDTLIVRPKYPVSPSLWGKTEPDATVRDTFLLDDDLEVKPGFDAVDVMAPDPASSRDYRWEDQKDDQAHLADLYIVPWMDVPPPVGHSAGSHAQMIYQGVVTETVTDDIDIHDGSGRLSKPFYGGLTVEWRYADLGALTVAEDGSCSVAGGGNSLAHATYQTQFHRWRLTTVDAAQVQIYVDVSELNGGERYTVGRQPGTNPAPAIVDPLLKGLAAMRERGRNYLAEFGSSKRKGKIDVPPVNLIVPGTLISVAATTTEPGFLAKAISVSISDDADSRPSMILGIEREAR